MLFVTGFAKMCIVHTSDFSNLKIHKICLDNWIYVLQTCLQVRAIFPLLLLQISGLYLDDMIL